MTSKAPKFRLLHLPRVALENVLRNFNDGNLVMFSLCSKRCNLVVKSFRHGFTGIQVILLRSRLKLGLSVKYNQNVSFVIPEGVEFNVDRILTLDGRRIWVGEKSPHTCPIFTNPTWALNVKVLIAHMVETFRVPFDTVKFSMDGFDNYRDFVQCFPKSDSLRICGVGPIPEERIAYS